MNIFTKTVTIRGESREVEFLEVRSDLAYSRQPVGAFQKRGGKVWAHRITLFSGERVAQTETILNRHAYRLIGWSDKAVQQRLSQHNSAARVLSKEFEAS